MQPPIDRHAEEVTPLDQQLAVPMFLVALASLLLLGAFFHLTDARVSSILAISLLSGLALCHLAMIVETWLHWRAGGRQMRQHIYYCLMPITRMCPHDHRTGERAWVPFVGWRKTTDRLEQYLARLFGLPMIFIALLVLPVVAIEFMYPEQLEHYFWFKFAVETTAGFIWMAFVFEFVVMISVVEKKWTYCRVNWIDLAVILLPLVSYMGAARLGRLVKLKQLSRTAKIYRMRGLALRGWRAIVALEVIDKILRRKPEHRAEKLRSEIEEKEREIEYLREQLQAMQKRIAQKESQTSAKPEAESN